MGDIYFSVEFVAYCKEYGIIHECFLPLPPQPNGLAE